MKRSGQAFYAGTSGVALPIPKSGFPPSFQDKSRLHYYASLFNSIEVNSSFYKLPQASTITRWKESVGDSFKFTFKLPKAVSHARELQFAETDVIDFLKVINHADDKKGCILIQFPPRLKVDQFGRVEHLLEIIDQLNTDHSWKIAVEFRNPSWYIAEIFETLNHFKAAMVIQDLRAAPTPLTGSTAPFRYLRFHGPEPRYRGSYSLDFLTTYAGHVRQWIKEGKTVYCYFNNTMGEAVDDLKRMIDLLG